MSNIVQRCTPICVYFSWLAVCLCLELLTKRCFAVGGRRRQFKSGMVLSRITQSHSRPTYCVGCTLLLFHQVLPTPQFPDDGSNRKSLQVAPASLPEAPRTCTVSGRAVRIEMCSNSASPCPCSYRQAIKNLSVVLHFKSVQASAVHTQ